MSSSDAVAAARKGRLKQRYDNEFRLVAGSVPALCLSLGRLFWHRPFLALPLSHFARIDRARCVPYRVKKDDEGNPCSSLGGDPAEVEVLMISTPNRADMVFPKVRGRAHNH